MKNSAVDTSTGTKGNDRANNKLDDREAVGEGAPLDELFLNRFNNAADMSLETS